MKLHNILKMKSLLAGLVDFVMDHASFANLLRLLIRGCPSSGSCGSRERDPKVGKKYRASHVLVDLGWVDLDLGSSPGWWAVTVLPTAQAGGWNISNPSQHNPKPRTWDAL